MPGKFPLPLEFEKLRLIHRSKSVELWEARIDSTLCLVRRSLKFSRRIYDQFLQQASLSHPMLLRLSKSGFDKNRKFCATFELNFNPAKLPPLPDPASIVTGLLSLAQALYEKRIFFRWDPEDLIWDAASQKVYLAGLNSLRRGSGLELQQNAVHLLSEIRHFAQKQSGTENDAILRILKKWERRKHRQLEGCLQDLLQVHGTHAQTFTCWQIPRFHELQIVSGLYQLAQKLQGRAVLFHAPPGEGKTSLLHQVYRKLAGNDCFVLEYSQERQSQPLESARKFLDHFFERTGAYTNWRSELQRFGWKDFLEHGTALHSDLVNCFFRVLELSGGEAERVSIFLIDDFERFDSDSRRILYELVNRAHNLTVLFVCTAKQKPPDLPDNIIPVSLEPLSFRKFQRALQLPFWKAEQKNRYLKRIYLETRGNPLLLQSYLNHLLTCHAGQILWDEKEWTFPEPIDWNCPKILEDLAFQQIPDLSAEEQLFLEYASAQGKSFDPRFHLNGDADCQRILCSLNTKGLIQSHNGKFQFTKPLIAEAIYKRIDPEKRRMLHLELVRFIRKQEPPDQHLFVAKHLLRSGTIGEAMDELYDAINCNSGETREMLELCAEFAQVIDQFSIAEQIRFYRQKGIFLYRTGRYPAAAESFKQAYVLAESEPEERFTLAVKLAQCLLQKNDILGAQKILTEQERNVSTIKNLRLLVPFFLTRGMCNWHRGEFQKEDFEKAIQIAETHQDYEALAGGYRRQAELALKQGSLREAQILAMNVLKYRQKTGDYEELGQALRILGSIAWRNSKHKKAIRILKRSIRAFRKIRNEFGIATVWSLLGNVYVERYRFREAISAFGNATLLFNRIGHPLEVSLAQFNLGLVYIEQGRLDEAERIYLRCRNLDRKTGNKRYYAYDLRALAVLSMSRGFHKKAERLLKRTLEICDELHAEDDLLQTKLILLLNDLEQNRYREASGQAKILESSLEKIHEPRTKAEIHYLLAHYSGFVNETDKAFEHLEQSVRFSRKIQYYKLIGMCMMLKLIFVRTIPENKQRELRRAIQYFKKSCSGLRLYDYLLMLYQAYPSLLHQKQHAEKLSKMQKAYRRIRNSSKYRAVQDLSRALFSQNEPQRPLTDWWSGLLQMLQASTDVRSNLQKLLGELCGRLNANLAAIRFSDGRKQCEWLISPQDCFSQPADDFQDRILKIIGKNQRSLCLDLSHSAENAEHPWAIQRQVTSFMAIPILKNGDMLGMWYLERWGASSPFDVKDLSQIDFFCTASTPSLENAFHATYLNEARAGEKVTSMFPDLIGTSKPMQELCRQISRLAPLEISVLILGESGTGKELVAKNLHKCSLRASAPFLALNCSAIPETLIESELFGYNRGAFTGAAANKAGLIERAHRGTLFLDEVGDLSAAAQAKLLRVMQEREIQRLGDTVPRKVDVRFLFATHKDLKKLVRDKDYREDLYYRISVYSLPIPPLRERGEDILSLASFFLSKYSQAFGKETIKFSASAARLLTDYAWPGNVREMENLIQSVLVDCESNSLIQPSQLPPQITESRSLHRFTGLTMEEAKEDFERHFLMQALSRNHWNKTHTARDLKITRQGLINMIQRLRLQPPE